MNMKYGIISLAAACCLVACRPAEKDYGQYVNPLVGTDIRVVEGKDKNSTEERGHIMPSVGVPHGMTNWVAQTQASENKCYPPYYYFQHAIQGFRTSHWMNGSCTQDYGSATLMPLQDVLATDPESRASAISHDRETATPSYYSVALDDYDIFAELTGLSRAGIMRFDFRREGAHYLVVEPNSDEGLGYVEIDPVQREIRGYNPVHRIYQGWGKEAGFSGYFVVRLDADIDAYGIWENGEVRENVTHVRGDTTNVGAWIRLSATAPCRLLVKVGTSFTDIDHARKNLEAEIPGWQFEKVRAQSSGIWNRTLGQIDVESSDAEKKIKFYTALHNTRFLPRTFSDVDGSYPRFDASYTTMNTGDGSTYYCDFSQWDTYRAVHPLFTLIDPARNGEMAQALVLKGHQGGWLPIFPSWNNYTAAMIGDHCISMLGDAIMKDIPGFDYEAAYALMRRNAFEPNTDLASYRDGKGRRAMPSYLEYGYIPLEDFVPDAFHRQEQVSRTLEYAYDDYVLAQVAAKLGKTADHAILAERARNYRHVIDSATGYARGRYADGRWIEPFDPNRFVSYICEGTPFHYTWYVPHDVPGLIHLTGGEERFVNRLDTFFSEGYYWHGNEPGHHIAYLYGYAGQSWKTQQRVHEIIDREYHNTPDGFSGNEDSGQMSAWLVFSMMGFYPVCPGAPYYVIGSPSFEKITLTLQNGKQFVVEARGYTDEHIYIRSATLNGQPYDRFFITHEDIMNGGTLLLEMSNTPAR
ncbi:MAG: GH92 family glycosyl hydrolase [Tannerella sp.]|jgi:predicted alpha-1,2-mannosidase|nr:GH92 family glycosyl hydrolase [Tannerella sp.]